MPSAIVRIGRAARPARPAASEAGHAAAPARLHPDHPHAGRGLTAAAMPPSSPPPPAGTSTVAHVRALLEDLQPDRALPGDDVDVVERVHEHGAGALGERAARAARLSSIGRAGEAHGRRRSRGSRRPSAAPRRSGMNTVAVIPSIAAASATPCAWLPALAATTPRARCAASSRAIRGVRAADLERARALQVLALQPHRAGAQLAQCARARERRGRDDAGEQRPGGLHVGAADGGRRTGGGTCCGTAIRAVCQRGR